MILAFGTKSADKLAILDDTLTRLGLLDFEIVPLSVKSGIPEQPIGEKVVKSGAENRASNAIAAQPNAILGIGMEAGYIKTAAEDFSLVCACAIISRKGWERTTVCNNISIPPLVSSKIKKGEEFARAIREYRSSRSLSRASTDELEYIDSLINRRLYFAFAIEKLFDGHIGADGHFYE